MIKDFEGKIAVITVVAHGIVCSLALAFVKHGMKIVIADIDEDALIKAAASETLS